jgi:hypothetical protein
MGAAKGLLDVMVRGVSATAMVAALAARLFRWETT